MDTAPADLSETAEDELDDLDDDDELEDDDDQDDEDERAGHARRWVRYVMPVMVEVDCDTDEIASVVTLPGEVRLDRDDMMNLCIYDEAFRRRADDEQQQAHALYVSEPRWQYPDFPTGRPVNWPAEEWHEDYFPRVADDDAYAEAHPYADGG